MLLDGNIVTIWLALELNLGILFQNSSSITTAATSSIDHLIFWIQVKNLFLVYQIKFFIAVNLLQQSFMKEEFALGSSETTFMHEV